MLGTIKRTSLLKGYFTFTATIRMNQIVKHSGYEWYSIANNDICIWFAVTVRNKFDTLQEISESHTPNDEYESWLLTPTSSCYLHTKQTKSWKLCFLLVAVREKWEYTNKYICLIIFMSRKKIFFFESHGKQHSGRKDKWINTLRAQRNA